MNLKELDKESATIATKFSLEELVGGARQFKLQNAALWYEINQRETMVKAEQERIAQLKKESAAISFGQLLTQAIGIKLRDEKA